ncbi:MAG: XTP/dITP diphosphohydrolase [Bacteroidales bacterium]|jgi:XTP/dITP diphosphohydrolase|nr:XTP/dITP diphosphohydrolase [Bacteroidales bacterium]MDN5330567.1 XTP/dITP diphosphohydrolase [Bacteroidales bacterium]
MTKLPVLVFATNNLHKLREVSAIMDGLAIVRSLADFNLQTEIPEEGDTLEANARQKAWFIYNHLQKDCFADDTGLEVNALGGRPGVYSARYAGEGCDFADNIRKLLSEMKGISDRRARFRTVVALIIEGREYLFEGKVEGYLLETEAGTHGFGYDPLFVPEGYDVTFAQMDESTKNAISHRGEAIRKMADFLKKYYQPGNIG